MSTDADGRTKYLIPFAYVLALIVPITAPIFALALYREHQNVHAVAVLVLAIVWAVILFGFIL